MVTAHRLHRYFYFVKLEDATSRDFSVQSRHLRDERKQWIKDRDVLIQAFLNMMKDFE